MTLIDFLLDGLFAAMAAVGFGSISNASWKCLAHCAWIAAVGHATRSLLMAMGLHIVLASFLAALVIGFLGSIAARKHGLHFEALTFVSLLPMIPGIYAYRVMQSFIMLLRGGDNAFYFGQMGYNAFITVAIILLMVVGVEFSGKRAHQKTSSNAN